MIPRFLRFFMFLFLAGSMIFPSGAKAQENAPLDMKALQESLQKAYGSADAEEKAEAEELLKTLMATHPELAAMIAETLQQSSQNSPESGFHNAPPSQEDGSYPDFDADPSQDDQEFQTRESGETRFKTRQSAKDRFKTRQSYRDR